MSSSSNSTNCLLVDGDIAGDGVRISFYIQNFILVLLTYRSKEDAENALWTLVSTSFGLTIAAIVQVSQGMLTLLDGIVVSQLAWFANFGLYLTLASYSRTKEGDGIVKLAAVGQTWFSMILTIIMWAKMGKFPCTGANLNINDVKFVVLFGVQVPVKSKGQQIALGFSTALLVVYTVVTSYELFGWQWKKNRDGRQRRDSRSHGRRPAKTRAERAVVITAIQLIMMAYFISTTELILHVNQQKAGQTGNTGNWGFGQVFAITVLLPSVVQLVRAALESFSLNDSSHSRDSSGQAPLTTPSRTDTREGNEMRGMSLPTPSHRRASEQSQSPTTNRPSAFAAL